MPVRRKRDPQADSFKHMANYVRALVVQGTRSEWVDARADDYTPDCSGPCPAPLPKGYPCACADWAAYQAL